MYEIIVNLHMHTRYSDGHGSHAEIAQAALKSGIDAVIVTDHNIWVDGPGRYYTDDDGQRLLLLVGEEIHDQVREPQKNHLLAFGANAELALLAGDPQQLVDEIRKRGGYSFLAHPVDPPSPVLGEQDLSWVDWQVCDFSGIELWNAMSEFKSRLRTRLHGLFYLFNPSRVACGPFPQAIERWDELLAQRGRVAIIGGSDAHAFPVKLGWLRRQVYPYEFHFKAVNTHVLLDQPLSGDYPSDSRRVIDAIGQGRSFIGYDLPAATRGFRFSANGREAKAAPGEELSAQNGVTFQIKLPQAADCRLIKDGKLLRRWEKETIGTYITKEPGIYRVEAYLRYKGRNRAWIFSNPIYIRP